MTDVAGWVAPIATAIAAIMTAANLGARITGWGFVLFTIASIGWSVVGFSTGQTNLLWTNGFLALVNAVGVWRWLGRQTRYEDRGREAVEASDAADVPSLLTTSSIADMPVDDCDGATIGAAMDAMLDCRTGRLQTIILRRGGVAGVGERLVAIAGEHVAFRDSRIGLSLTTAKVDALPEWKPEETACETGKT